METHDVVQAGEGFVIMPIGAPVDMTATAAEDEGVPDENEVAPSEEQFFRIKFSAKTSKNDTEDVILACQGEVLTIQREEEVTLPARFVEVAEHARTVTFSQRPGELRKRLGEIVTYPYTVLGPGRKEDYLTLKQEGHDATQREIQRMAIAG